MKKIFTLLLVFTVAIVFVFTVKDSYNSKNTPITKKLYSQKKAFVKGYLKKDSPNKFAEYYREIRTEVGSDKIGYPDNYLEVELNKALKNRPVSKKQDILWESRGPSNVGGRSRGIVIDPDDATANTWYIAAVGGGVWKTTDAGNTWNELTSSKGSLSASYLTMAPSNHNVIYLGTGEGFGNLDGLGGQGIWKSTDRGVTWNQLSRTAKNDFGIINRIIVDPNNENILLACTSISNDNRVSQDKPAIWKSTDGGNTWTNKYSNDNRIHQIICNPSDFNIQFAAITNYGIIKSIDAGEHWALVSADKINGGRIEMAVAPSDPTRLYASAVPPYSDPPSKSELFISSDSGTSWTKLNVSKDLLSGQGWYDNAIIVNPYDKDVVYVAGVNIYKVKYTGGVLTRVTTLTDNYGSNPSLHKGTHVDNHFFAVKKLNEVSKTFRLVGTNDGGVCYTDNEGSTFTQPIVGFVTSQFYGVDKANGKDRYIGGMQDNSCFASPLNASSSSKWKNIFGGDGFDVVWNYEDDNKFMMSSQYNNIAVCHKGLDNFNATAWLADVERGSDKSPFFTRLAQSKSYPDLVFTFSKSGVWRTEDFGTSWNNIKMPSGFYGSSSSTQIKISLASPDVVWAGRSLLFSAPMYVSTNFGGSFSQVSISNLAKSSLSGFATHPSDKNTAYALFSTYGNAKILKTTDLGKTWEDLSGFDGNSGVSDNGFPDVAVFDLLVMPYNDDIMWAGTEIGIFESTDGGANWHLVNSNLPPVSVYDLLIVNDEVVIGTHGRGVWTVSLPELQGYEPPSVAIPVGLTTSYIFENSKQYADINLSYKGNYETVKVYLNDELIEEYSNVVSGDTQALKVEITALDNTIDVVAEASGVTYKSSSKVNGLPLKSSAHSYVSDFNSLNSISDDFYGEGFSISQPTDFDSKAINTPHPYKKEQHFTLYLRTPIVVNQNKPNFVYSDVAIIEPGEDGVSYPDEQFWDYVSVEGSVDGQNWVNMVTPYDAAFDSSWNTIYSNNAKPKKSNFIKHSFNTTSFFKDGDEILIRFILHSDAEAVGWGWIIDDLEIQKGALSIENNYLSTQFKVYPNPVVNEVLFIESTSASKITNVKVYNLSGQTLLDVNFASVDKAQLNVSNFTKGQYLLMVKTDNGSFSKKILVD